MISSRFSARLHPFSTATVACLTCLSAFACLATRAQADTPGILTANGPEFNFNQFAGGASAATVGWSFTVGSTALSLTQLGIYDAGVDGLGQSHQVGLFSAAGSLLTSVTVQSGTASALTGSYRYESVATPVTLAANTTYVVGAFYAVNSPDRIIFFSTQTFDSRLTYEESRANALSPGQTFSYPGNTSGGNQSVFGPNFQTVSAVSTAAPEPGSLALLLPVMGTLSTVGMVIRKRRK